MTFLPLRVAASGNSLIEPPNLEQKTVQDQDEKNHHRASKMDSAAAPTSEPVSPIHRLPNEVLVHILRCLDSPSGVQKNLVLDPTYITRPVNGLQTRFDTPVKTASLVCRLWRRSLQRLLFRNIVWAFQRFHQPSGPNLSSKIGVLDFLHRTGLSRVVETFTILIDTPNHRGHGTLDNELWGLLPPQNNSPGPSRTRNIRPSPVLQRPDVEFRDPEDEEYAAYRAEQAWREDHESQANPGFSIQEPELLPRVAHENNWLWHLIFEQLDPLQFTLIGSIKTLSSLLGHIVDFSNYGGCNNHRHIVSLSRTSRSPMGQDNKTPVALLPSQKPRVNEYTTPSDLFSIRDWTSLLVNEGSFAIVYARNGVTNYSPPTLLPYILNSSNISFNHIQKTLKSFSYVAIFPPSKHIREAIVPCLPPVEHVYLQMAPHTSNFCFPGAMHGGVADIWLEFDTAYAVVMREMFDREVSSVWKQLQAFESGDASNEVGWSMAMQYVQVHGLKGWKMKSRGYFVRNDGRS
ncbi:hypothetical protein EDB81DRAFT_792418 [Dactylonectria macrodidyma]|uniref:F-box domain-containing protein n=1 Tax=Dactylonectria macrodidyma TaxID=307937 RepID=A0A9P9J549_9HYPO|nr:hypothetical protein EDB81DRAFT_792418 [Dactylonectria macrodidyma]